MTSSNVVQFGSLTAVELQRECDEHDTWQATLHPSNPQHDDMFRLDLELGYLDVYWGGYEYSYELKRLRTPAKLLAFISHIGKKRWRHSTAARVARLVDELDQHFGWEMWHQKAPDALAALSPRTTSNTAERAKITPKLRYDVLYRDDFRCRACGASVETGAHLHIDHIKPISKGGKSELGNLQALCSICNQGKGAR